ncbi:MAG: YraN family protein [Polyangiaceae bacterium]
MKRAELGRKAELAVVDYLVVRGFSILGRNVRLGALELDIVAQKGSLVAVVEVRTRGPTARQGPFESIGGTKRVRLRRAVERLWREKLEKMKEVERVRIDAAAVSFEGGVTSVEYVEGAIG